MVWCFTACIIALFFLWNGEGDIRAEGGETWRVKINIPAFSLTVYRDGEEWGRFPVAVGKPATQTPQGVFHIASKVRNPTWYPKKSKPVPPGPRNPLGGYWLGLSRRGYGIHGNNNAKSIGHSVSNGCIRMRNKDIQTLFRTLPTGTLVEIEYRCLELSKSPENILYLKTYPDVYHRIKNRWQAVEELLATLTPEYPAHTAGLGWLLTKQPYGELEVPRRVALTVDGQPFLEEGFLQNGQVYLPATVNGLWSGTVKQPVESYIPLSRFLQENGEGVRVNKNCELAMGLQTIRVVYPRKQVVTRGRWQREPLVDLEQLVSVFDLAATPGLTKGTLYCDGQLITDLPVINERLWMGISRLTELNGGLQAKWDPAANQVEIDYVPEWEKTVQVIK